MLIPALEIYTQTASSGISMQVQNIFADAGIVSRPTQLIVLLVVFLTIYLFRTLLVFYRDRRVMELGIGYVDHWRSRLVCAFGNASWSYTSKLSRSDIEYVIMNDVRRLSVGTDRILRGSVGLIMLITQALVALWLSPTLSAIIFAFLLMAACLLFPLIKKAQYLGKALTVKGRHANKAISDFLSGLKLAKAHRVEQTYVDLFNDQIAEMRHQQLAFFSDQQFSRSVFQLASAIFICVIIAFGLFILDMAVPILTVIILIMARLTSPFLSLMQGGQAFANMLPAFANLVENEAALIAVKNKNFEDGSTRKPAAPYSSKPASIEFDKVTFKHPDNPDNILVNACFKIHPGAIVSIQGASGAGKTTLVDLMIGLIQPDSGSVLLNDIDATENPLGNGVCYVPQDPFLFGQSIRENLLWPDITANDDQIHATLNAVGLGEQISKLPDSLDTQVGERGISLSGGERQRVCLARALLRHPQLLILDEATNAIDFESESKIYEVIRALHGETTVVVISHHSTGLLKADLTIELKNDEILLVKHK